MAAIQARAEREGCSEHIMWLVILGGMTADEVSERAREAESAKQLLRGCAHDAAAMPTHPWSSHECGTSTKPAISAAYRVSCQDAPIVAKLTMNGRPHTHTSGTTGFSPKRD